MKAKTLKMVLASSVFMLSLIAILGVNKGHAFAAAKTWTGSGGNSNFSTSGNWSPSGAPTNGDSIVLPLNVIFSTCTTDKTLNNDLVASSVTLAGISVTGSKPTDCFNNVKITGNEIKSSANVGTADKRIYLEVPLTATADLTINSVRSTLGIATGSHTVTIASGSTFTGSLTGTGSVIFTDEAGGFGGGGDCDGIAKAYPISGDSSSFTGAVTVQSGASFTVAASNTSLGHAVSGITSSGNSTVGFSLNNGEDATLATPLTINGGSIYGSQQSDTNCSNPTTAKTFTISGNVTLTAATSVSLWQTNLKFTGNVTGKDFLSLAPGQSGSISFADGSTVKSELKVVTIDDAANCSDAYDAGVSNTKLVVNADCTNGDAFTSAQYPYTIAGILAGIGKVGNVKIASGGVIAPGHSPGTIATLNIEWVEGGTYEFEIGKDAADKIVAVGTVTLGNGTLTPKIYDGAKPTAGTKYVIIDNDGSDAVVGTFKNLPEGATFTADGYIYQVSYVGGDGNDVTLTIKSVPKAPNTGIGMITNNPLLTLAITTASAATIFVLARRRSQLAK